MSVITFMAINDLPEVAVNDDLSAMLLKALKKTKVIPGDILIVTHKIVSKANGYVVSLDDIKPSEEAKKISQMCDKDPKLVEIVLQSSDKLYCCERGILMSYRKDGWVCANAGVDASNSGEYDRVIILPDNCDIYAKEMSERISSALGFHIPVIICDTHGRALRQAAVGVTVGSWGLEPIRSYIGMVDRDGRVLRSSREAVSDEISAAATLVMGQGDEGVPAVLLRGYKYTFAEVDCSALKRMPDEQIFRIKDESLVKNE